MNVYVWHMVEKCTDNYHSGGGVVVFAESLEEAIKMAAEKGAYIKDNEAPDEVRETFGPAVVYIMPDAGCC